MVLHSPDRICAQLSACKCVFVRVHDRTLHQSLLCSRVLLASFPLLLHHSTGLLFSALHKHTHMHAHTPLHFPHLHPLHIYNSHTHKHTLTYIPYSTRTVKWDVWMLRSTCFILSHTHKVCIVSSGLSLLTVLCQCHPCKLTYLHTELTAMNLSRHRCQQPTHTHTLALQTYAPLLLSIVHRNTARETVW